MKQLKRGCLPRTAEGNLLPVCDSAAVVVLKRFLHAVVICTLFFFSEQVLICVRDPSLS